MPPAPISPASARPETAAGAPSAPPEPAADATSPPPPVRLGAIPPPVASPPAEGPAPAAGEARPSAPALHAQDASRFDIQSRVVEYMAAGENASVYINRSSTVLAGGSRQPTLEEYRRRGADYADLSGHLLVPEVFRAPEAYLTHPLLALIGPDASGKYSAAVCFAAELLRRSLVDEVYDLPDDTDLPGSCLFAASEPRRRRLFIVTDVLASSRSLLKRLLHPRGDPGAVRRLRDACGDNRLLITISPERLTRLLTPESIRATEHRAFFLYDYAPQPRSAVLRHHLARRAGGGSHGAQAAERILARLGPELEQSLAAADVAPPRIGELADLLHEAAGAPDGPAADLGSVLAQRLADFSHVDREIKAFLEQLPSNEDRVRAIQLAFLEGCTESEFWRLSALLQPETLPRRRPRDWFAETATVQRERLRAEQVSWRRVSEHAEAPINHLRFRSRGYAPAIRRYAKREHPDLVRAMLGRLITEIARDSGLRVTSVGPRALGLMAHLDWPRLATLVCGWAESSGEEGETLAAPTLAAACLSADARTQADGLLEGWRDGTCADRASRERYLAAAAAVYRHLGSRQFKRAAEGLHRVARHFDLSALAMILPFDSHWAKTQADPANLSVYAYVFEQSEVAPRDDEEERKRKTHAYLDRIAEAHGRWARLKPIFESVQRTLLSLALLDGELEPTMCLLCDWLHEADQPPEHTIRLTAALIAWRLLQHLAAADDSPPAANADAVLALAVHDPGTLDMVGELFAGTLGRLHTVELADKRRLSRSFCETLEKWCRPLAAEHAATLDALLHAVRGYLARNHPSAARYFDAILTRDWQGANQPESTRRLARAALL